MDEIKAEYANLTELSDDQVGSLESQIVESFQSFSTTDLTADSITQMTELADMLDGVRAEFARREAQAAELSAKAQELSARVNGAEAGADEPEEVPAEETTPEEAPAEEPESIEASAGSDDEDEDKDEFPKSEDKDAEASVEEPAAEPETAPEAEASVEETPTEAAAEVETAAEASAEVAEVPAEETAAPEAEASVAEVEEAAAEASAEAPVEAEASVEEITADEQPAQEEAHTVTASANGTPEVPADRRPLAQVDNTPVTITAGADLPGVGAGQSIPNMNELADKMAQRIHALRRVNGGDGEQVIVASLRSDYSEAHVLDGTAEENWAKVTEAKDNGSLVASGGFGTPVETRYDIFGFGTDERPVKASLPKFQADRGGVRFVKPPVLSSYADAVGVWSVEDDIAAANNNGTNDTVKNSLTVTGAVEQTAYLDAVTLQLKVGNLLSRAYPELVARHNELALIQHAREAELNLLSKINAASTAVTTSGTTIGVARDFLVNVRRAATAYRSRHRISPETRLQAIIPTWVVDALAADLTLNMPGDDNISVAKATIRGWLNNLNVTLTESLDQNTFGAQPAGALLEFPDAFTWFLFSEGSFLFLDGGTLDIGVVRDSGLVATNDYKMFTETFEGLAFVGIESLAITSTISVNGAAAALVAGVDY